MHAFFEFLFYFLVLLDKPFLNSFTANEKFSILCL
jgi:hypothetical protein